VAAGQAQRLSDADPSSRVAIVGLDGRPRWHPIWDGNPILATPADVERGESVRTVRNGPGCRPYIVYPFDIQQGWTFNRSFKCREHRARLYLTYAEQARGETARTWYGPYVLIEPYTKHPNFAWPVERWAQLVESCPDLTFVQHVHAESAIRIPGCAYEPASFREACGLIASASLYVRSESGLCHAAAALGVRQVTLFGGCMDPDVMGGYPGQRVLADVGPGSPCGKWLPCTHCAAAMQRLTSTRPPAAIYGRLLAEAA